MSSLDSLLSVQDLDTRLDQIEHRRGHLPEDEKLTELASSLSALTEDRSGVASQHHDLEREQKRIEDEVASLDAKATADNEKLYDGSITSPKDAGALQDEIASLRRRQTQLEDDVLELMEQAEPLAATLAGFDSKSAELDAERGRVDANRTVALAELDAECSAVRTERGSQAAKVDVELIERYEKLRSRSRGGIVIGRIEAGRCTACGLGQSSMFLDRVKGSDTDEIHQCEECGVMLAAPSSDS